MELHSFYSITQTIAIFQMDLGGSMIKQGLVNDCSGDDTGLPRNFRDYQKLKHKEAGYNSEGIFKLRCMASGQYNIEEFEKGIEDYDPKDIIVIDARKESHWLVGQTGAYSWYQKENEANLNRNRQQILDDECSKMEVFQTHKREPFYNERELDKDKDKYVREGKIDLKHIQTEQQFVLSKGCKYYRMPVLDHNRPSDEVVQDFLDLMRTPGALQKRFYIHCKGGMGRATTLMVMLDILVNPMVPLNDIIERQCKISGKDLIKLDQYVGFKACRREAALKRLAFIQTFYNFAHSSDFKNMNWMTYANNQYTSINRNENTNKPSSLTNQYQLLRESSRNTTNTHVGSGEMGSASPVKIEIQSSQHLSRAGKKAHY